jgi:hypothetical protein
LALLLGGAFGLLAYWRGTHSIFFLSCACFVLIEFPIAKYASQDSRRRNGAWAFIFSAIVAIFVYVVLVWKRLDNLKKLSWRFVLDLSIWGQWFCSLYFAWHLHSRGPLIQFGLISLMGLLVLFGRPLSDELPYSIEDRMRDSVMIFDIAILLGLVRLQNESLESAIWTIVLSGFMFAF